MSSPAQEKVLLRLQKPIGVLTFFLPRWERGSRRMMLVFSLPERLTWKLCPEAKRTEKKRDCISPFF